VRDGGVGDECAFFAQQVKEECVASQKHVVEFVRGSLASVALLIIHDEASGGLMRRDLVRTHLLF
jgi:hypothetical protein